MDEEGTEATGTERKGEAQTHKRKRDRSRDRKEQGTARRHNGGSARGGDAGRGGNGAHDTDGHNNIMSPGWGAGTDHSRHNLEEDDHETGVDDDTGADAEIQGAVPGEEAAGGGGSGGGKKKRGSRKGK